MGRKMVIRILSISVALLFLGVFLPSLTSGEVNPASVDFGEVVVGYPEPPQTLSITNQMDATKGEITVLFFISYPQEGSADCGFSLAYGNELEPLPPGPMGSLQHPDTLYGKGDSVDVEVIFDPTNPGECSATLLVAAPGVAQVSLHGIALEAPEFTNIIIDEQDTGVLDFKYEFKDDEEKLFSVKLEEIAAKARNHGQYVWMVVFWTRRVYRDDKIDKEQMKAIIKAAAHAKIPKDGVIKGKKEKHHRGRHAAGFGSHGGHHK